MTWSMSASSWLRLLKTRYQSHIPEVRSLQSGHAFAVSLVYLVTRIGLIQCHLHHFMSAAGIPLPNAGHTVPPFNGQHLATLRAFLTSFTEAGSMQASDADSGVVNALPKLPLTRKDTGKIPVLPLKSRL